FMPAPDPKLSPAQATRDTRYSHRNSPRPSVPGCAGATPSRCRLTIPYPPFSVLRKCRNCAEMDASPYRVTALNSPSVSHVSQSAADSITSRMTSRCERNRRASYSPRPAATLSRTPGGSSASRAEPSAAPLVCRTDCFRIALPQLPGRPNPDSIVPSSAQSLACAFQFCRASAVPHRYLEILWPRASLPVLLIPRFIAPRKISWTVLRGRVLVVSNANHQPGRNTAFFISP